MKNFLKNLFSHKTDHQHIDDEFDVLINQMRILQLDLEEKSRLVISLQNDLDLTRKQAQTAQSQMIQAKLEDVMTDLAPILSQAVTQKYLLENLGRTIQAKDIVMVYGTILNILEQYGFQSEGVIGEKAVFDPLKHLLISQAESASAEDIMVIRFPGFLFNGKRIRKAGVERFKENQ
jgi:molecular chaperone GrpE (heat shock protein)